MKEKFIVALTLLGMIIGKANAAYVPITINSGFNADLVANGIGPAATTTNAEFDFANHYGLVAADYQAVATDPLSMVGLPLSGTINSIGIAGLTFQMADYSSNNALYLTSSNNVGTLAFTATGYSTLYILTATTNGSAATSATIHFSDGSSQMITDMYIQDWYYGYNAAINGVGRVSTATDLVEDSGTDPKLYQMALVIDAANVAKTITDISFSLDFSGSNTAWGIFAISGNEACNSAPAADLLGTTTTSACIGDFFHLSLANYNFLSTNDNGYMFYWQKSTDSVNWSTIDSGIYLTYLDYQQSVTTYYRCIEKCPFTGDSTTSNAVLVTQNPISECYCTTEYADSCNRFITGVTLPGEYNTMLQNPSMCEGGAVDFTSLSPATFLVGSTYNLMVNFNNLPGSTALPDIAVWIDYNDDADFDYTEKVAQAIDFSDPTGAGLPLDLSSALPGIHRMRIVTVFGEDLNLYACSYFSVYQTGETEDYSVNIVSLPLSIHLKSIDAVNTGLVNHINWSTSSEHNTGTFEVERSSDAKQFSYLASVTANGKPSDYSYTDNEPFSGINYYRLKLSGADGQVSYSKVVAATVATNDKYTVAVFPNPAQKSVTIKAFNTQNGNVTVTDLSGRVITQKKMEGNELKLDISALAKGFYLIRYVDGNVNKVVKLNKQ